MEVKKLTICFFGDADTIHTVKWVSYFAAKGHKVHLISYSSFKENDARGVKLHIIKRKFSIKLWPINTLLNMPFALLEAKKIIREIKPDIIHAHYLTSYGTLALLSGFHPFVLTAWGTDILVNAKRNFVERIIAKTVFNKADLITCDAEHMKKAMIGLGADASKIKIINFGVDTKRFSPGVKDNKVKKYLGVSGGKTIISLRSLEPLYDIESLIKAASIVLKESPKTKFVIVGNGSRENDLKIMARESGISDSVRFTGRINNNELPKYLRVADVYVSTSLSDAGIAASTAEAMACGMPAIVTDSGENRVWIKDNEGGYLIPTKNPEILADRIIRLINDKNLMKEFGKRNRRIIEEKNSYFGEMAKMEEIYKKLIK